MQSLRRRDSINEPQVGDLRMSISLLRNRQARKRQFASKSSNPRPRHWRNSPSVKCRVEIAGHFYHRLGLFVRVHTKQTEKEKKISWQHVKAYPFFFFWNESKPFWPVWHELTALSLNCRYHPNLSSLLMTQRAARWIYIYPVYVFRFL